eukprot:TRINITY_DN40598_c0_g1_i1.p1 TRINITY_DN40598_c0_g1~~TRINITY_DN40598_c0_g1_i1.p1  ORF type:complete len:554 (-),score=74.51 TRINITY_DN40598_c0_g1_i1:147-1808(-)
MNGEEPSQTCEESLIRLADEREQVEQMMCMTADLDVTEEMELDALPTSFIGRQHAQTSPETGIDDQSSIPAPLQVGNEDSDPNRVDASAVASDVLGDCGAGNAEFEGVPSPLASEGAAASALKGECAECSICFAELPSLPVCVLVQGAYGTKRSCRHYFHHECVQMLIKTTPAPHTCPLCRQVFVRAEPLPDVRFNSSAWFKSVDCDGGGSLDKQEVIDALSATLPVDPLKLGKSLDGELWAQWDTDATGRISKDEFENPSRGLLHFVLYSLPSLKGEVGGKSRGGQVPDLESCREGWFRYWDENCQHMLEFLHCLRALSKTLRLEGEREGIGLLRSVLMSVWQEYGLTEVEESDNVESNEAVVCHRPAKSVSMKLFCEKPDGFCDALLDSLRKAFGPAKFQRIKERAELLQQPVSVLKQELRKLKVTKLDVIEKSDIVDAILNAKEAAVATPKASPETKRPDHDPVVAKVVPQPSPASPSAGSSASDYRSLPLVELRRRLKDQGIQYGHCVERRELEELLRDHEIAASGTRAQAQAQRTSEKVSMTRCCSVQ